MARTLTNFQTDFALAVGTRGNLSAANVTRFINDAYLDLCSGVDFDEMIALDASQTTTVADRTYTVPTGALAVFAVRDETNAYTLARVPVTEYYRRFTATSGKPKAWTQIGSALYLDPAPAGAYALSIAYRKTPTLLSGANDLIAIPTIWEPFILYMAIHYAVLTMGEEARGRVFLERAIVYGQSRLQRAEQYLEALANRMTGGEGK